MWRGKALKDLSKWNGFGKLAVRTVLDMRTKFREGGVVVGKILLMIAIRGMANPGAWAWEEYHGFPVSCVNLDSALVPVCTDKGSWGVGVAR